MLKAEISIPFDSITDLKFWSVSLTEHFSLTTRSCARTQLRLSCLQQTIHVAEKKAKEKKRTEMHNNGKNSISRCFLRSCILILSRKTDCLSTNMRNSHALFTLHIRFHHAILSTFFRTLRLAPTLRRDRLGCDGSQFDRTDFLSQLQRTQRIPTQSSLHASRTRNPDL